MRTWVPDVNRVGTPCGIWIARTSRLTMAYSWAGMAVLFLSLQKNSLAQGFCAGGPGIPFPCGLLSKDMRYLVTARVRPGREQALLRAIEDGTLGRGSVAGDEYLRNMAEARLTEEGSVRWVEVCFCYEPLDE